MRSSQSAFVKQVQCCDAILLKLRLSDEQTDSMSVVRGHFIMGKIGRGGGGQV